MRSKRSVRRGSTYYTVTSLRDGTVIAAYPVRKPSPHIIKRDGLHIDEDNVCVEYFQAGENLRDGNNETRFRFQDLVVNRLNMNRALRTIVLKRLDALESAITAMQKQLDRIEAAVCK